MNFENVTCEGCGRKIEKNDDIVVCPVCGTPQHRECYEKNSCCVNADKHEIGFEWHNPQTTQLNPEQTVICPVCGEKNSAQNQNCKRCGTVLAEKNLQNTAFNKKDSGAFSNAPMGFESSDDIPQLSEVIEARVKTLAPGITPEQRQEKLCGHEIGTTVSFIGNNAAAYVGKFRKKERLNKKTFNWAAFFFTPFWFFWRRMYKAGSIYLSFSVLVSVLLLNPMEDYLTVYQSIIDSGAKTISPDMLSQLSSAMIPILILYAAMFILHLIAGFTADGMYHRYCTASLDTVDELERTEDNFSALSYYLKHSSTGFIATLLAMAVYYFLPSLIGMML
ncbi:MAG: RING finger protein [Acutalibacteraceae bacterium]